MAQDELCGLGSAAGVQEWMTQTGLIVVPPDMSLRDAGLLLRAAVVTGAPVVEDGHLVGVVSRNDLLTGLLSIPLDAKQDVFESEIARMQALLTYLLTYLLTHSLTRSLTKLLTARGQWAPDYNLPTHSLTTTTTTTTTTLTYCCRRCPCASS